MDIDSFIGISIVAAVVALAWLAGRRSRKNGRRTHDHDGAAFVIAADGYDGGSSDCGDSGGGDCGGGGGD
jgi:hypothetical protein